MSDSIINEEQLAPLMPHTEERKAAPVPQRQAGSAIQNLLQLSGEAERQANLTAEAAETTHKLAQELLADTRQSGGSAGLYASAGKNAILATEAAVRAQLAVMETYAAAINQSLVELESVKDSLHQHSQSFIHLSRLAAQAQEEADQAREQSERARLEYAAKQNAALSSRDTLAQAKKEYEARLAQARIAQENLELTQNRARNAQKGYLELRQRLDERRELWQGFDSPPPTMMPSRVAEDMQPAGADTPVLPQAEPVVQRRQIAAITLPAPLPPQAEADIGEEAAAQTVAQPAAEDAPEEAPEKESRLINFLWLYGKIVAIALVLVLCIRLFVLDVVLVEGISMLPTLHPADSLISSKIAYLFHEPQRFDIILMDAPDENGYYVKRVIGLPNEQIQVEDGKVYIDGKLLEENFIADLITDGDVNTVIPDGYYYVMGDNRPASRDSRTETIGPIAREHINGKAILRVFPLNTMQLL